MVHLWALTMFDKNCIYKLLPKALLLLVPIIAGCAKSFVVTSEVPPPLIERLPVTAEINYTDEFSNYQYIEKSDKRALEKVDFGSAQVGMFETVFGHLFTLVAPGTDNVDLKITPQLLDFQYSAPSETKLKQYEIWVKYRLTITDHSDQEIADWVVKGYGKTPTSMLGSQITAFNTASNIALRDIGAQLAIGFHTQPSIEDYLTRRKNSQQNLVQQATAKPTAASPSGSEQLIGKGEDISALNDATNQELADAPPANEPVMQKDVEVNEPPEEAE